MFCIRGGMLLDLIEPVDRKIEFVSAGILDGDEIDGGGVDFFVEQSQVFAHAMLDMDDEVTGAQSTEVLDKRLTKRGRASALCPTFGAAAENFFFRDEDPPFGGCDDPLG